MGIRIIPYEPRYAPYFDRFNRAWLVEYFTVEPIDEYVLENPEAAIIGPGGKILFAAQGDQIIGTVALRPVEPGVYELTKMAVDKSMRGTGAGKLLCAAAIREARQLNAHKVILYSQSQLSAAIAIYRKMGFVHLPVDKAVYQRADVKMELCLTGD